MIFLNRVYNVYKVGQYRVGELFYAQTLSNLLSMCIAYAFVCLMQMRLLNILPMLLVLVVQSVICAAWCLVANCLYFSLHPPRRTLFIYETEQDLGKLAEVDRYGNRFIVQHELRAGLTGTEQVYDRYNTAPKDKLKMDLMYINNMSFGEDLKLMFATARILLMKESTSGIAAGHATASEKEHTEEKSA